ncbi:unnamed protein product [Acanthoscelides obtectus]|uniref:GH18 domain-containing protein n=1 Tax=Acanthoscelides obtectus TaxID=200917 RepID=A0A9P0NWH9_ACAOB|nr:unnamed protein product [Acanthoscelides obtectus]CAK1649045.1 Acidic mammalian chitinase [Acanthoscelides obtectus]
MFNPNANYRVLVVQHIPEDGSRWYIDKRIVVLFTILMCPVILFCATYMLVFGIFPGISYPKALAKDVPEVNIHRALVYSMSPNTTANIVPHSNLHRDLSPHSFKIVCYYNFPGSKNSLQVENLQASLCTHISVAFASISNNSIYLEKSQIDTVQKLVNLKSLNKNLKILVSVGGAGNDGEFPKMVLNHANRKSFIRSVIEYVKEYNIDGVDLDWEFPNEDQEHDKMQKVHFTQLLSEFRKSIEHQPNHPFLLTVAVAAPDFIVQNSYDVSYMNEYVDFVNLMSYDYHYFTKETPFTGYNSPLYASENERYYLATLNINYSANYWNMMGMDRKKIVIGLPTYGHSFRLMNPKNNGLYAPASGYGKLGALGFVDYPVVCQFLNTNRVTPVFDMDTKSSYASKYYEWISFDNQQSLTYKAEYIRDNGFGGAMVYSLNSDDWKGACKQGEFPLVESVRKVLEAGKVDVEEKLVGR